MAGLQSITASALKSGTLAVTSRLTYAVPHLSGAIDVVMVCQPDGSLRSSPFYVRFGKYSGLRTEDKRVAIVVNDQELDFQMVLGRTGEAYFATESWVPLEQVPPGLVDELKPQQAGAGEADGAAQRAESEDEFFPADGGGMGRSSSAPCLAGSPAEELPAEQAAGDPAAERARPQLRISQSFKPSPAWLPGDGAQAAQPPAVPAGAQAVAAAAGAGASPEDAVAAGDPGQGPPQEPPPAPPSAESSASRTADPVEGPVLIGFDPSGSRDYESERASPSGTLEREPSGPVRVASALSSALGRHRRRARASRSPSPAWSRQSVALSRCLGELAPGMPAHEVAALFELRRVDAPEALAPLQGAADAGADWDGYALRIGNTVYALRDALPALLALVTLGPEAAQRLLEALEPATPSWPILGSPGLVGRSALSSPLAPTRPAEPGAPQEGEAASGPATPPSSFASVPGSSPGGGRWRAWLPLRSWKSSSARSDALDGAAASAGASPSPGSSSAARARGGPDSSREPSQEPGSAGSARPTGRQQRVTRAQELAILEQLAKGSGPTSVQVTEVARLEVDDAGRPSVLLRKRAFVPTQEQLAAIKPLLRQGQNTIRFRFDRQELHAFVYLMPWSTRLVVSDIDGTITKSDVLGHLGALLGYDWTHEGITNLFSEVKENGYDFLFLSSRSIAQASITRDYLHSLIEDGKGMPPGPVIISPDGLFPSLYREVILRRPHEFKIRCLEDIRSLFPPDWNPFYAGFGNRDTDEVSYLAVGVPPPRIFIINPKGELRKASSVVRTSTTSSLSSLRRLVDEVFPALKRVTSVGPEAETQREEFSDYLYWRVQPPITIGSDDEEFDDALSPRREDSSTKPGNGP